MADEMFNADFECQGCNQVFNLTNIQKLQHVAVCKKPVELQEPDEPTSRPSSSNQKLFKCSVCLQQMHLTNIEILKHKKSCRIKKEKE